MKKFVMILSLVAITSMSFAQGRQGQGQRPEPPTSEERIAKATEELSLTDAQVVQWEEIFEKYEPEMKGRDTADDTRKEMGAALEATLTEEQLVKFKEMRQNQGGPPPNRR